MIQPKMDQYFSKGLETWKTNNLSKIVEDEVTKRNPVETPEQKQIRELTERLNKKEAEEKRQSLMNKGLLKADEKKLPKELVSFFLGENEDATTANLTKLEEIFNKHITESVEQRVDFKQGEANLKVRALDGIPIIRVPSARMKTAYVLNDGTTSGQETGGFTADAAAKNINWIISARNSAIAISKTDNPRIFDPQTNQKANAWKIDYRKYHDLFIPDNKLAGVYVNVKEALA